MPQENEDVSAIIVSCGKLVIIDHVCNTLEETDYNIIKNVLNGRWFNISSCYNNEAEEISDELYLIHENYKPQQLHWENYGPVDSNTNVFEQLPSCELGTGLLSVFDYDKFFSEGIKFDKNHSFVPVSWGIIEPVSRSSVYDLQIGTNGEGLICGIRHFVDAEYTCDSCLSVIKTDFYTCKQCNSYELCLDCFNKKVSPQMDEIVVQQAPTNAHDPKTHIFIKCDKGCG